MRAVTAPCPRRNLGPQTLRRFAPQIAEPMDEAPLRQRAAKTRLDGADQPRRPVGDEEQRIGQAAALESLEKTPCSSPCPPWFPAPVEGGPARPPPECPTRRARPRAGGPHAAVPRRRR